MASEILKVTDVLYLQIGKHLTSYKVTNNMTVIFDGIDTSFFKPSESELIDQVKYRRRNSICKLNRRIAT